MKEKYEAYYKLSKIISSCETIGQIRTSKRMINLFFKMFNDPTTYTKLCTILTYKIGVLKQKGLFI